MELVVLANGVDMLVVITTEPELLMVVVIGTGVTLVVLLRLED